MRWLALASLLALLTVSFQAWFITTRYGADYITHTQLERSAAIANHTARAPYRYRLLSDSVFYELTRFADPQITTYIFRFIQNLAIFLLAGLFFKTLQITARGILIGWLLIAYAMAASLHQSDFAFNSYMEIIFGLAAAIAALHKKMLPFILIVTFSAFNRESSILLSALWLIHVFDWQKRKIYWRELVPVMVSAGLFLAIYISIYLTLGPAEYSGSRYGSVHPGLALLWLNLTNPRTWVGLILMYFPILILWVANRGRKMANFVWIWGAGLALPWYSAMLLFGSADETRLFLLPLVLWALPAALSRMRKP